nr:GIY-YIG nuclease family protein [Candidatus Omnitrophota bacterium]
MQRNQKKTPKKRAEKWFLYMLRCADASLYTGIAKDIDKRFKVHSSGKGARYTRARLPVEIVYR